MQNPIPSLSTATQTPSKLGAFMSGLKTGSINGGLMLGIFSVVGLVASGFAAFPLGIGAIAMTAATTGIFSGILGVKRVSDNAKQSHKPATGHAKAAAPAHGHAVAPQVELAETVAPDAQQGSWVARTSGTRTDRAQSRVEQILANGSMADKDRAAAILAARENAVNNSASIG